MSTNPAGHLEMLRRITEQLAGVREPDDVTAVLEALAEGLVQHGGLAAVQIWLYMPDSACPHCAGRQTEDEEPVLHSLARAGRYTPITCGPTTACRWAGTGRESRGRTREPFLANDLQGVVAAYRADPESSPLMKLGRNWDADIDWCDWGGFEGAPSIR
ncbi:MAG: hypothetical protein R2862_09690 [Thermoanaerobaculia bacterium]